MGGSQTSWGQQVTGRLCFNSARLEAGSELAFAERAELQPQADSWHDAAVAAERGYWANSDREFGHLDFGEFWGLHQILPWSGIFVRKSLIS